MAQDIELLVDDEVVMTSKKKRFIFILIICLIAAVFVQEKVSNPYFTLIVILVSSAAAVYLVFDLMWKPTKRMLSSTRGILIVVGTLSLFVAGVLFIGRSVNNTSVPPLIINQLLYAEIPDFALHTSKMVQLNRGEIIGPSNYGSWIELDTNTSSYTTGDFNGDGFQDIAATIRASGGGSGTFYHLVLFTNDNGSPKYFTDQLLGDRITINSIGYSFGVFSVDIITQGPNDPMCCGTLHEVVKYRIQDGSLVLVSSTAPTNNADLPASGPGFDEW